jgi:heme/copper-type cytochrome/quinol oxidase subunit 3
MSTESLVNKEALAPEEPEDFGERWRTGAILLIVADGSFVVALSFAFLYLRGTDTQTSFHPGGTGVASLWWPWIVTAVMIASFLAYRFGLEAHEPGRRHFLNAGVLAVVGMAVALVLNIVEMYQFPFHVIDNAYSSAVWVIAAGNVFHLLITVFLGLGIVTRVQRRKTRGAHDWHVRIVGIWYAWVCVTALIGTITITVANGTVGCPLPQDQPDPGARSVLVSSCPSSSR